tara:strand:+ start:288 stop:536 length:249 start_codon:yes stop_codon:yes gene_type:complete
MSSSSSSSIITNRITRKANIIADDRYVIWFYSPFANIYSIERSYPGRFIRDTMWNEIKKYNRANKRQYMVFPDGVDPNERKS